MPLPTDRQTLSRRSALKTLAALPLALGAATAGAAETEAPASRPGFALGAASISLKSQPLDTMLATLRRLGVDAISLHRSHLAWDSAPAAWAAAAERIRAAGVTPRCCGVLYLKNSEPEARALMEYAKALGVSLVSCSLEPAALPLLEKLVREYGFRAAIHNHGPEDKVWPTAASVWQAVQALDPRIGLCLDVGHSYRAGEDVPAVIRQCRGRLYDVHVKDSVAAVGQKDVPAEAGRGAIDLRAVLTALIESGYHENVWLEYEKDPNDPVPGFAESLGYLRGLVRGLTPA